MLSEAYETPTTCVGQDYKSAAVIIGIPVYQWPLKTLDGMTKAIQPDGWCIDGWKRVDTPRAIAQAQAKNTGLIWIHTTSIRLFIL
jgi:hypothetical protein